MNEAFAQASVTFWTFLWCWLLILLLDIKVATTCKVFKISHFSVIFLHSLPKFHRFEIILLLMVKISFPKVLLFTQGAWMDGSHGDTRMVDLEVEEAEDVTGDPSIGPDSPTLLRAMSKSQTTT